MFLDPISIHKYEKYFKLWMYMHIAIAHAHI